LHEFDTLLSQIYFIFLKSFHVWLFKGLFANQSRMQDEFFILHSHGRGNRGRGNWNQGLRRPMFSIHFDVDSQELDQLFHARFFNWIGQGIVQPRHERPPFQAPQALNIPILPHVSLQPEVPEMMDGRRLSTRQSPNIVAGPTCPCMFLRLLTPLSKLPLTTC
jgi:hypothetical protein